MTLTSAGSEFGVKRPGCNGRPTETWAILYWEVEDFDLFREQLPTIMMSDEEFHVWNRERLIDIFGFAPGQPQPEMPELVADSRV